MAETAKAGCTSSSCIMTKLGRKIRKMVIEAVVAFLFFITCLLLNFAQLVNYLLFEYTFPSLRQRINAYFQDIILSQTTILLEWHCGVKYRLFFANQETKDKFGREHCLALGNHRFQVDALFYWLCCEMTNTLRSAKAYAKSDLRWMPIIGWAFFFGDFIFLKRNWREDEKSIGPALDRLMSYPFPYVLLILPEGTRFTEEKHQAGMAYAKEHNIPVNLKYHLLPRVKGFAQSLRHLQSKYNNFGVYNIQLVSRSMDDPEAFEPSLENFIAGKPFKVDCYVERIDNKRLPAADADEETEAKFVYSVFEKKDELMEYHRNNMSFPETADSILRVKKTGVYRWIRFLVLNFAVTGSLVLYLLYLAIISHSLVLRITIYGLILLVFVGIFLIISFLQNSNYGQRKDKKATTSSDTATTNGDSSQALHN